MTTDANRELIDADPCSAWAPDPERAARLDAAMERLLAEPPIPADAPRRRPRVRTLAGLAATAAACAIGLVIALPGSDGDGTGLQTASAATVLRDARNAVAAGQQPGPWTAMTTKSWTNRPFPLPGGGTGVAVVPATIEQWSSDTGAQLQRITQGTDVQFPHPGDRAAYASVDPQPVDPNDGKMVRRDVTNGGGATVADVRSLPTDPDALAARLTRDGDVIHQAAIMLLTPLPTTELRQALYTVLARTPGSRLEQGVRDPDGRTGDGVHFVRGNDDTLLLFDTQTHELLGVRTVNDQRAALGRTLVGWDLVLDTHRAEEAPKADVEQRFPADSHGRLAPVYVPAG